MRLNPSRSKRDVRQELVTPCLSCGNLLWDPCQRVPSVMVGRGPVNHVSTAGTSRLASVHPAQPEQQVAVVWVKDIDRAVQPCRSIGRVDTEHDGAIPIHGPT